MEDRTTLRYDKNTKAVLARAGGCSCTTTRRRSTRMTLFLGDCLDVMPEMEGESVQAIVTDPPYGNDMGVDWDHGVPGEHYWREVLRLVVPGAHMAAFGDTRTFHRLAVAMEDAGWEIRDTLMWIYGSGFPRSHNVRKAMERAGYADAADWEDFGSSLKPAWEPIILARRPLEGTYVHNVRKYGTGALNIGAGRIETDETLLMARYDDGMKPFGGGAGHPYTRSTSDRGRWPANVAHDGSEEVVESFPTQGYSGGPLRRDREPGKSANNLSVARYFYCAKASAADRNEGLPGGMENRHMTVKPIDLMRWIVRMVTPPGGAILDPFMGTGSTGKAAALEGFAFAGIERDPDTFDIAWHRVTGARGEGE